jgi:2-C-methyl-D-erythritol 4-phosphate cytidylyltransferase / 2-C-methyl-D-erythritol 2,4-cyclodiphosphate synthase
MSVTAIIVAGGRGERAGSSTPKQFVDLGGGRTLLTMTLETFLSCDVVTDIVVAAPAAFMAEVPTRDRVRVVAGGARRQDSMANALRAVPQASSIVLVHDAARPYASRDLIARTVDAARIHGAAIAAIPVRDTVKRASGGESRRIVETLPRDQIFLAQTPQAFRREVLEAAVAQSDGSDVTDEALLVERAGIAVHIVEGEETNVKITTGDELRRAAAPPLRVGTGYDLHRLVAGRPLVLGGVTIPFELGLQGHSDADIVCHAVTDAVLGAAALGDIGQMFPDTDARWRGADSLDLLRAAVRLVRDHRLAIVNVDVTVIAERPKLRPYVDAMRRNLADALGIEVSAVSLKGKTNETVDATGRGEAMACHAVALLAG